jgi:hypothetical protein
MDIGFSKANRHLSLASVAKEVHLIITSQYARTVHENYMHDTTNNLMSIERYIGFLDGLHAAEVIDFIKYHELRDILGAIANNVESSQR